MRKRIVLLAITALIFIGACTPERGKPQIPGQNDPMKFPEGYKLITAYIVDDGNLFFICEDREGFYIYCLPQ